MGKRMAPQKSKAHTQSIMPMPRMGNGVAPTVAMGMSKCPHKGGWRSRVIFTKHAPACEYVAIVVMTTQLM